MYPQPYAASQLSTSRCSAVLIRSDFEGDPDVGLVATGYYVTDEQERSSLTTDAGGKVNTGVSPRSETSDATGMTSAGRWNVL